MGMIVLILMLTEMFYTQSVTSEVKISKIWKIIEKFPKFVQKEPVAEQRFSVVRTNRKI